MQISTRFSVLLLYVALESSLNAQLVISTQNPDNLFVCGSDQMMVSVKNNAAITAANLVITIFLPSGLSYVPGSVSGATESNISNLNAGVFAMSNLNPGEMATCTINIHATCALVASINAGQLFSNNITANSTAGNAMINSSNYAITTGLLLVNTVEPISQSGVKGDVKTRVITIRNSRLGPISSLHFEDQHSEGISLSLQNVAGGNNTATTFISEIPGSFFTAFGNGNNLLDYNETATITELITIEACDSLPIIIPSIIQVGWGCDNTTYCQYDSISAQITVLPVVNASEQTMMKDLFVSPNPFSGKLIIQSENGFERDCRLRIVDASGKLVHQAHLIQGNTLYSFDMVMLPAGTYWLRIQNTSQYALFQLIKE